MTNNTTIVKDFSYITGFKNRTTEEKKAMALNEINPSKFSVMGPLNGVSTKIRLKCRFHNIRNKKGMWTAKRK
jgi:hypothetical protein